MGTYLHKLGVWAFSHPWRVVAMWAVLLAMLGLGANHFMKPTSSAISIPGTQAQVAIDRAAELFPDNGKGSARIVLHSMGGTLEKHEPAINALVDKVEKFDGVEGAINPLESSGQLLSDDKTIGIIAVQLRDEAGSVSKNLIGNVESATKQAAGNQLEVEIGGGLVDKTPGEILGVGEIVGVVIALVVLLATLGSLVSAGLPIITALVAIGVSTAGLFSFSQLMTINATTPVLGVMLGLAVGIDYSLFIVSKYRQLLLEGHDMRSAAGRALGTAGNAVVFAALTVVIALAALSVVQIPFMTMMGLSGAASIAVAALVALTLLPALLGLAGMRVFGRRLRAKAEAAQKKKSHAATRISHRTFWYKWGEAITRRPWTVLVLAVAIVAVIALPVRDLTMGLPTDQYAAKNSTERKAYDLTAKGFGAGYNGQIAVVVENLPKVSQAEKDNIRGPAEKKLNEEIAKSKKKQEAYFTQKAASITTPEGYAALKSEIAQAEAKGAAQLQAAREKINESVKEYAKYVQLQKVAKRLTALDNVDSAQPVAVLENGTAGIIQVVPNSAPADAATADLIETMRDSNEQAKLAGGSGATLAVTGSTALEKDINAKLTQALPTYLLVVVGLSLVLLVVAFRSVLVPIKATLGFLLSVAAMFGAMVAVFQWGWFGIAEAPGPLVSFIPIIAIGVLFGLAMDYEFFLVSGMHEAYAKSKDARGAVVNGFAAGSKVVTAAGVIMVSVFAGFITNHDATIQAIGFGLAIGILVDAFIVRMTIVPAIMTLLGRNAWWLPKWLNKRLPHISIEGEE